MIRILIAEDEPAAGRYLKSLVEQLGAEFTAAVVQNGGEALDQIRRDPPDLVLTDVQMPVLDGIGLLEVLRREFPAVATVIVSGYQEFEYARKALSLGVADYLLKPVSPSALHQLLTDQAARLHNQKNLRILDAVHRVLGGEPPPPGTPARFLAALVRWGGPVSFSTAPGTSPGRESPSPRLFLLPGRDRHETVILADADQMARDTFETQVRSLDRPGRIRTGTLVFTERPVAVGELAESLRTLGPAVDRLLVFGRVKLHWGTTAEAPPEPLDPTWTQKLRLALAEGAYHRLETLVRGAVAQWARDSLPARRAAALLRQTLHLVQNEAPNSPGLMDWEFLLEAGLGKTDSFDELADLAWNLFAGVAGLGSGPSGPVDAPETHQRIRRFLQTHYAGPLSLNLVCDRFQVSQTSLSRLFRKYEGCTFHEYLTRLRLDAAEALLSDSPGLPLKTVASAVGYQDPFHFSRAFKALKGRPPSSQKGRS